MLLDFLVIGAGRSGTTWVWELLSEHPQCFVPQEKELHYFNREPLDPSAGRNPNFGRPLDWYHAFFETAQPGQILGELSPGYLWSATAPTLIRDYNPEIKLIAILRDPVDRAFSHYLYRRQRGNTRSETFEEEIERHPFILDRGLYGRCLERYLKLFAARQVKVLLHDDLKNSLPDFVADLEAFLGIDSFLPESVKRVNSSSIPKFPTLTRWMRRLVLVSDRSSHLADLRARLIGGRIHGLVTGVTGRTRPFRKRPRMNEETAQRLRDHFVSDISLLEDLLAVDLSIWREPPRVETAIEAGAG